MTKAAMDTLAKQPAPNFEEPMMIIRISALPPRCVWKLVEFLEQMGVAEEDALLNAAAAEHLAKASALEVRGHSRASRKRKEGLAILDCATLAHPRTIN